jgi:hypothetical protein
MRLESFFDKHMALKFSHSICPPVSNAIFRSSIQMPVKRPNAMEAGVGGRVRRAFLHDLEALILDFARCEQGFDN